MSNKKKFIKRVGVPVFVCIVVIILFLLHRCEGTKQPSFPVQPQVSEAVKLDTPVVIVPEKVFIVDTVVLKDTIIVHDTIQQVLHQIDTVEVFIATPDTIKPVVTVDSLPMDTVKTVAEVIKPDSTQVIQTDTIKTEQKSVTHKLFALKINLLTLPLTVANIELEVPITEHVSVAGEWLGTWWWDSDHYRGLHLAAGAVEGKYWFKEQVKHEKLSGFFVGVNAGGGIFDYLLNSKGYKGEYMTAGITAGFAHSISNRLSMEYSLGVGSIYSSFEYLTSTTPNVNIWRHDANLSSIGLTRARIALSWYF